MPQNLSANGLSSSFTPPGSSSNKDANSPPPRENTGSPPQNSNWSFEEQFKQVRQVSSGFTDDAFWGTLHLIAWMTQTLVEFLRRQYQGIRFKTLLWRHTPELTLIVKSRNKSRLLRYIPRCRNINVVTWSYGRHIQISRQPRRHTGRNYKLRDACLIQEISVIGKLFMAYSGVGIKLWKLITCDMQAPSPTHWRNLHHPP